MRRRFFVERFDGATAALRGEGAHHLSRVLRAESGQLYELSDGETVWLAQTRDVSRDAIEFALVEPLPARPSRLRISLLLAIVKFDRFEWAIEKATELGVVEIAPISADRSDKGLVAASAKRAVRWEKILLESAQQSRRLRVPALLPPQTARKSFAAPAMTDTENDAKNGAHVRVLLSERPSAKHIRDTLEPLVATLIAQSAGVEPWNVTMAIGPEGGWTDEEFAAALAAGFAEVSLGKNILRTETAVCAALSAIQYAFAGE
jgi:16S rRNA (uracil1498-N3)-methyltransferase